MRYRVLLERFTLGVLVVLLALALLGFVTLIATETMRWVVFPKLGERFFVLVLPALLGGILALSFFNLTLNQGILATRALAEAGALPERRESLRSGVRLGLLLCGLVGLCLGVLFAVSRANMASKGHELEDELQALVEQHRAPLERLARLVEERREPAEVGRILAAIASTTPSFRDLALIVPTRTPEGVTVFKRIDHWWGGDRREQLFDAASSALLYSPDRAELAVLRESAGRGTRVLVLRPYLRVLHALPGARGQAVAFLYSANHRYGHAEYK